MKLVWFVAQSSVVTFNKVPSNLILINASPRLFGRSAVFGGIVRTGSAVQVLYTTVWTIGERVCGSHDECSYSWTYVLERQTFFTSTSTSLQRCWLLIFLLNFRRNEYGSADTVTSADFWRSGSYCREVPSCCVYASLMRYVLGGREEMEDIFEDDGISYWKYNQQLTMEEEKKILS